MAVKLNKRANGFARSLISEGRVVRDERDAWSEHQPTTEQENAFIQSYGLAEYAKWHLGIDDDIPEDRKGRYKFPYGDFKKVHRCAILSAESRAGQYKHFEAAVARLHEMIDGKRHPPLKRTRHAAHA
jgi:hypothetical protein